MVAVRPGRWGRLRAFVVAFLVAGSVLPSYAWSQTGEDATSDATARLKVLGTFKRFPENLESLLGEKPKVTLNGEKMAGWPFMDTKNRQVFQLYELDAGGVAILIRNLDSFKKTKVVKIPQYRDLGFAGPYPDSFPDGAVEIDEEGRRLFLWANLWNGASTPGVVVVDWSRDTPRIGFTETPLPDGVARAGTGTTAALVPSFTGMSYEPSQHKLYLRTETDSSNAVGMNKLSVVQLDAAQDDPTRVKVEWSRWIRACRSGSTFSSQFHAGDFPVLFSPDHRSLFIPCNPGAATAVARVPLSEAGVPVTEEVFAGIGFAMDYSVDRVGQRIHIKTTSGPTGIAILTFDLKKLAYVGLSALVDPDPDSTSTVDTATPMGVDEVTGRVYALSSSPKYGLTVIEGRLSPVPPGRQFPQVRYKKENFAPPAIRVDPQTRRIFVPRSGPEAQNGTVMAGDFLILQDEPVAPPAPVLDVDSLTSDVKDDEGVTTQADFSGGASGYGVRLLLAGGARGVPPVSFFEGLPTRDYGRSPCRASDRDFVFGRTERTFLSSAGRSASSIAGDADLATKSDLGEPSRCRDNKPWGGEGATFNGPPAGDVLNGPNGQALMQVLTDPAYNQADNAARPWAFRRTECPVPNEDGTTREKDSAKGEPPFAGSVNSVNCYPTKAQVTGASVARLPLPGSPITFGDAASFTEIVRDPKRGLVSRAIAYVRDIDIGGVVQIDGVYAVAESFATGRPEKSNRIGAGTKYIRAVTGFTSPGYSCGHEGEDACGDPSALVDGVNRAFVNLGLQLRFPPLEPDLAQGSPAGYQSGVQREFFNSLNAEFANGDILKEVPALEIVRTNDSKNWGRQRQTYQFAAVLVNSQYGIRSLGDGFEPLPGDGSTDPVPPGEQVLGEAVGGLAAGGSAPVLSTTGGSPGLPPALADAAIGGPSAVPVPGLGRRFTEGLSFLMRNPKTAGLMVGAWILLLLPGALAYRRRLLMNAVTSTGRGTS